MLRGVVASNHPVAATGADGESRKVAAFGSVGAGTIATVAGVVIDGAPQAVAWTGERVGASSMRVPEVPAAGLCGAPSRQPRRASSVSNCNIPGFLLIISGTDLRFSASDWIQG